MGIELNNQRNAGGRAPDEVRALFARVARRYDLLNHLLSLRRDVYWRSVAAREAAGLGERDVIADLCTGTGDLAFALRRAAPASPLIALDFTPEMLAIGKAKGERNCLPPLPPLVKGGRTTASEMDKAQEEAAVLPPLTRGGRGGNVLFALGDSLALPLRSDSIALASVAFGIRNVGDWQAALGEMVRVVRPGGKVVVLEFSQPPDSLLGRLYRFYFSRVLPRVGRLLSGASGDAYRYLPRSVQAFATPEELCALMRELGLTDVRATSLTFGVTHFYVGVKPGATQTFGAAEFLGA